MVQEPSTLDKVRINNNTLYFYTEVVVPQMEMHKYIYIHVYTCIIYSYLDDTTGNKFWEFVCHILHNPTKEQKECHHPKPILLDTG